MRGLLRELTDLHFCILERIRLSWFLRASQHFLRDSKVLLGVLLDLISLNLICLILREEIRSISLMNPYLHRSSL